MYPYSNYTSLETEKAVILNQHRPGKTKDSRINKLSGAIRVAVVI